MPFAMWLQDSLRDRHSRIAREFATGESLETALNRHLLAIEASADNELLTSILLLDETGTRILHGAAPNLPKAYCKAIHGAEIGPKAGSCGTAAYTGRATYETDIAAEPVWDDYRCLALPVAGAAKTAEEATPGFEGLFALTGLLGAACLLLGRRE